MKLKNIIVPAIAILVSAAVLLGVNFGTANLRAQNIQKEHVYMMQTLLPGSENFVRENYAGDDANVKSVHKAENGFVVETESYGYAGPIRMMVGVSNEGKVTGLVVEDMQETRGLGAKALTDVPFLAQFLLTTGEAEVGTNIDALTGATVSSKAVTKAVNSAVAYVTGADTSSSATEWGG